MHLTFAFQKLEQLSDFSLSPIETIKEASELSLVIRWLWSQPVNLFISFQHLRINNHRGLLVQLRTFCFSVGQKNCFTEPGTKYIVKYIVNKGSQFQFMWRIFKINIHIIKTQGRTLKQECSQLGEFWFTPSISKFPCRAEIFLK